MKAVLCLLALLPIVWCATIDERFVLDSFGITTDWIVKELQNLAGSDLTEQACESTACPALLATIPGGALAGSLCGPACQESDYTSILRFDKSHCDTRYLSPTNGRMISGTPKWDKQLVARLKCCGCTGVRNNSKPWTPEGHPRLNKL